VVGYTESSESYVERVGGSFKLERGGDGQLRDEHGMAVEEFYDGDKSIIDNLMVACGMKIWGNAEEGIAELVRLQKEKADQKV
jgi:hypothetical protein